VSPAPARSQSPCPALNTALGPTLRERGPRLVQRGLGLASAAHAIPGSFSLGAHLAMIRIVTTPACDRLDSGRPRGSSSRAVAHCGSSFISWATVRISGRMVSRFSCNAGPGCPPLQSTIPGSDCQILTIPPLRTLPDHPRWRSRTLVMRSVSPRRCRCASPVSMTSPTPYWSSMIMKMPAMTSLTRLCAPKASAIPPTPADASSGASGTPGSPSRSVALWRRWQRLPCS